MEHEIFCNGNKKRISWVIKTDDSIVEQKRGHADIYRDQVTDEQSKYIALHIGLFWGIGTFIIKNEDNVSVMLDSKSMFEHLSENKKSSDEFIEARTEFIRKFITQRKLKIKFVLIEPNQNKATKLL